ncbi:hypothetical protein ACFV97_07865 [Streptomyces sp. NPDC059913]|uniref:hypothetical protein n=1 Tax=unclassified Streptomyces TaxID=2593676 RepID=UPI00365C525A
MLPENIPTVTVTARYLTPDGRPLTGTVTLRAPAVLTFPDSDVILGGPVVATLDATGAISATVPATDAPGMDPDGWAYVVTEQLAGVPSNRSYAILLPAESPDVDLADIAPTDPGKPNYIPVEGIKGDTGATGAPGSRIYSGSDAPAATLGVDGDLYVRYETSVFLGVTSTTVSTWQKNAGAWAQLGADIRGAAWYVNTTSTPSSTTRPGDLLLRTDTGDIWQRNAGGWGNVVGNIKGPKGDQGVAGVKGDQGPTGAPGVVQSINGKSQAAVVLAAADVGAVANDGGSIARWLAVDGAAGTYRSLVLRTAGLDRWQVQNDGTAEGGTDTGSNFRIAARHDDGTDNGVAVFIRRDNRRVVINGTSTAGEAVLTATGAIGAKDVTADPATSAGSIQLYSKSGLPYIKQGDGTVFQVGAGGGTAPVSSVNSKTGAVVLAAADVGALATTTRGAASGVAPLDASSDVPLANLPDVAVPSEFAPADLGMVAWAYDPVLSMSTVAFTGNGSLRFTAVVIRQTVTVSKVVMHFGGYAGTMNTGSWVAIYTAAGARKATSADLAGETVIPGVHNAGGATVGIPLTASVSLTPGVYYIAYVFRYSASDGPMCLALDNAAGSPPNVFGLNSVKRFGVYTATVPTTAPTSITTTSIDNGANRFWAGLA